MERDHKTKWVYNMTGIQRVNHILIRAFQTMIKPKKGCFVFLLQMGLIILKVFSNLHNFDLSSLESHILKSFRITQETMKRHIFLSEVAHNALNISSHSKQAFRAQ